LLLRRLEFIGGGSAAGGEAAKKSHEDYRKSGAFPQIERQSRWR